MKHIPAFLSVIALMWVAALSLRFAGRALPWIVPAYLIAQCSFVLIGWWGIQRNSTSSYGYLVFFGVAFGMVLFHVSAFATGLAFLYQKLLGAWLILTAIAFATALAGVVYFELRDFYGRRPIPPQFEVSLVQGVILFAAGVVTLVALFHAPLAPELRFTCIALGGFWTSLGLLSFAWPLGLVRRRDVWIHLNDFLPAFLAIVAFVWLGFQLSRLQAELSHEYLPHAAGAAIATGEEKIQ